MFIPLTVVYRYKAGLPGKQRGRNKGYALPFLEGPNLKPFENWEGRCQNHRQGTGALVFAKRHCAGCNGDVRIPKGHVGLFDSGQKGSSFCGCEFLNGYKKTTPIGASWVCRFINQNSRCYA